MISVRAVDGLVATDVYGMAAYRCTRDQQHLEPIPESAGVLRCPACGHRTDETGTGTLADAFDIAHRQFGLRGDFHAWHALRELVAATPTPTTTEGVRTAFVDALREVADVDIDHNDEQQVYGEHLNHGGMSGGFVHIEWWRTKGIPLLVNRAVTRRPPATPAAAVTPAARKGGGVLSTILVWLVLLAIPAALVGGGGWLLYQRAYGTSVHATVLECDSSGTIVSGASTYRTDCIAQWTIDGRVEIGAFNGGNGTSDVGKTIDATVRNGGAYSRSLALPIVLIVLGLPFLILPVNAIRRRVRQGRSQLGQ